jgi:hypothetical protein
MSLCLQKEAGIFKCSASVKASWSWRSLRGTGLKAGSAQIAIKDKTVDSINFNEDGITFALFFLLFFFFFLLGSQTRPAVYGAWSDRGWESSQLMIPRKIIRSNANVS